jgi:hypothetical protein
MKTAYETCSRCMNVRATVDGKPKGETMMGHGCDALGGHDWQPAAVIEDGRPRGGVIMSTDCRHPGTVPVFDNLEAAGLSAEEVRRRWPRFDGPCPTCGVHVIAYASVAHFIMGDW